MKPLGSLLIVMAGVAAGFVVFLWAGFHWHHQPAPAPIDSLFPPAALVLVFAIVWLTWHLARNARRGILSHGGRIRSRADLRRDQEDWKRERREMHERLAADPIRRPYLKRIERGEHWSEAQIDYDLDPDATATCAHLAPIERAMRRAGMRLKLGHGHIVNADCTIDEPALRQRFAIELPAWYGMIEQYDRSLEDPPAAAILCREHGAMIYVVAPRQAERETPRFPE